MSIKTAWKYVIFTVGVALTAIVIFSSSFSKTEPDCLASEGQTVVRWKNLYGYPCKYSWKDVCIWPIDRKHASYKVTVYEAILVRDEKARRSQSLAGRSENGLFTIR